MLQEMDPMLEKLLNDDEDYVIEDYDDNELEYESAMEP